MAGKNVMVKDGGGMGTGSIEKGSGYDYEMGGAPKKEKISKTSISMTVGDGVRVVRAGKKMPVIVAAFAKAFKLENGDRVETGEGSYVFGLMDVPTGDNPCTSITLFPGSAIEISTRHSSAGNVEGGADVITKVKFLEGMMIFGGPCEFEMKSSVPVKLAPSVFGNSMGFSVEMRKDGTVAFYNIVAEIEHTRAKVKAPLFAKEVIAAPDALYSLPALEPRYAEAWKVAELWAKAQGGAAWKSALAAKGASVEDFKKETQGAIAANIAEMRRELAENEDLPRNVAADYKKQIETFEHGEGAAKAFAIKDEAKEKDKETKVLEAARRMATEGDAALSKLAALKLPSPQALDEKFKVTADKSERRTMGMDDYMRHAQAVSAKIGKVEEEFRAGKITKPELSAKRKSLEEEIMAPIKKKAEHAAEAGRDGKPLLDAALEKAKIGKTVQYGAIAVEVRMAEKGPEMRNMKSPQGSLFLAIGVKVENTKSASTAYIVPDEEMWLSFGAAEPIKPENYKFETALDPKKPSEGYVWYIVPSDAKKFSLMLGKKKMPKLPVDFSL